MKKLIAVVLCLAAVLLCLCSCAESIGVRSVEEKIDSLGAITLDNGVTIKEIEEAYAALSEKEQGQVGNYDGFLKMKVAYDQLVQYNKDAKKLLEMYDVIFTEAEITANEIQTAFDELRGRYETCPEATKTACGEIFNKLSAANDEYKAVAKVAEASAAVYVRGFIEQNPDKEITVREIGCIADISDGSTYFLFAMIYDDSEDTDKRVYSAIRFTGTPAVETTDRFAADLYRETPALEKKDALLNGNIVIDTVAVLDALKQ